MIAVGFAAGKLKLAGSVPDGLAEPTSQLPRKRVSRVPFYIRGGFLDRPLSPRSIKIHLSVVNAHRQPQWNLAVSGRRCPENPWPRHRGRHWDGGDGRTPRNKGLNESCQDFKPPPKTASVLIPFNARFRKVGGSCVLVYSDAWNSTHRNLDRSIWQSLC